MQITDLIPGILNVKKILAVINATYAVAKRKPTLFIISAYLIHNFILEYC